MAAPHCLSLLTHVGRLPWADSYLTATSLALDAFHLANQGQVEACAKAVLEEQWCSRAVEPSLGNDGDSIAKEISLIHVVSGHDDGSACEGEVRDVPRQALERLHSNLWVMWLPELGVNEHKPKR